MFYMVTWQLPALFRRLIVPLADLSSTEVKLIDFDTVEEWSLGQRAGRSQYKLRLRQRKHGLEVVLVESWDKS